MSLALRGKGLLKKVSSRTLIKKKTVNQKKDIILSVRINLIEYLESSHSNVCLHQARLYT